jgi:hypothetical protein
MGSRTHEVIEDLIYLKARELGYLAEKEKSGPGWCADVLVTKGNEKVAFEIQLSPQTYKETQARQDRFKNSGVTGCWLHLRPYKRLYTDLADLPLFYLSSQNGNHYVNLIDNRKTVLLGDFIKGFLQREIKYCTIAKTCRLQKLRINFIEMACWKCKAINHIYYLDNPYVTSCSFAIDQEEAMWGDDKNAYLPHVLKAVNNILKSPQGSKLRVGEIKKRFSGAVGASYSSFGCYKCDSIFGDWFVMHEELDARNGITPINTFEIEVEADKQLISAYGHWCYPEDKDFCDLPDTNSESKLKTETLDSRYVSTARL